MADNRILKSEVDTLYNEALQGLNKNELIKRNSRLPTFLAYKAALDAGLIEDGETNANFDFSVLDVKDASPESFSKGVGKIYYAGGTKSGALEQYTTSENKKGRVESVMANEVNRLKENGDLPLVTMIVQYSDNPTFTVSESSLIRRAPIIRNIESKRASWVWHYNRGNLQLAEVNRKSYQLLTIQLSHDEFMSGKYWEAWVSSAPINRESFVTAFVDTDGFSVDHFGQGTIRRFDSNYATAINYNYTYTAESASAVKASSFSIEKINSGKSAWNSSGGGKGVDGPNLYSSSIEAHNNRDAEIEYWSSLNTVSDSRTFISGTVIILFKRTESSLDRIFAISSAARDNAKSIGIIAEGGIDASAGKGASIAAEIDKQKQIEKDQADEQNAELLRVTAENPGEYIVKDVNLAGDVYFRVAKVSEASVLDAFILANGQPTKMQNALSRNEPISFAATDIAALRKGEVDNIDVYEVTASPVEEQSPPEEVEINKSFKKEALVDESFTTDESSFFKSLMKSAAEVVGTVANVSRKFMQDISEASANQQFVDNFLRETNVGGRQQAINNFKDTDFVGMKDRNQLTGYVPKDIDRPTHAVLRIVRPRVALIPPKDNETQRFGDNLKQASVGHTDGLGGFEILFQTDNFILQSVQETDSERVQLVDTFGDPIAFFYGRQARIYTFNGILLDTRDHLWRDLWKHNYENFLRGTRCVRNNCRAYLSYDESIREGFVIQTTVTKSTEPNQANFSFQMFITREMQVSEGEAREQNQMPYVGGAHSLDSIYTEEDFIRDTGFGVV